jgi:uncharacterized membrane protein
MRLFSVGPALNLASRRFRWLGGWDGKPFHPPLTDIPIGAYLVAALFDLISYGAGSGHSYSRELYVAGTYTFRVGLIVSILTAITGLWDWFTVMRRDSQAWRTANTHMTLMLLATIFAIADNIVRSAGYPNASHTPGRVLVLSLITALLVAVGATFGGSLVFDYGVSVGKGVMSETPRE